MQQGALCPPSSSFNAFKRARRVASSWLCSFCFNAARRVLPFLLCSFGICAHHHHLPSLNMQFSQPSATTTLPLSKHESPLLGGVFQPITTFQRVTMRIRAHHHTLPRSKHGLESFPANHHPPTGHHTHYHPFCHSSDDSEMHELCLPSENVF